jgi:hypothetical protein
MDKNLKNALIIIALCFLLQGCTIRDLWNGLLDFNLMWIVYFIIICFVMGGLGLFVDWCSSFVEKKPYVSDGNYNDIGKERSAINLLMRWIILIPLLMVVGWFLFSWLELLIPPSWYECYPSIC